MTSELGVNSYCWYWCFHSSGEIAKLDGLKSQNIGTPLLRSSDLRNEIHYHFMSVLYQAQPLYVLLSHPNYLDLERQQLPGWRDCNVGYIIL